MANCVVTGASSGIGREVSLLLAERGYVVVLAARREPVLLEMSAECLRRGAPSAVPVVCDVRSDSDVARLAEAVQSLAPSRLGLVNAAGTAHFGCFAETSIDRHIEQVDVNLGGMIRCVHALMPQLLEHGGDIVNVLSIAAITSFPGAAAYCASKAGALAFGRSLALDLRGTGVRVMSILPGAVDTPLWKENEGPERADMLSARAVAETIVDMLATPLDRTVTEIVLMPPKGIL